MRRGEGEGERIERGRGEHKWEKEKYLDRDDDQIQKVAGDDRKVRCERSLVRERKEGDEGFEGGNLDIRTRKRCGGKEDVSLKVNERKREKRKEEKIQSEGD